MLFYATYWKDGFFQRHLPVKAVWIEKSEIETRKTRISVEIDIQKNLILFPISLRDLPRGAHRGISFLSAAPKKAE